MLKNSSCDWVLVSKTSSFDPGLGPSRPEQSCDQRISVDSRLLESEVWQDDGRASPDAGWLHNTLPGSGMDGSKNIFSILKWSIPGSFFIYFRLFKQILQSIQLINMKNVHPVYSIRCCDLNPRPSEHESPRITTGPVLQAEFKNILLILMLGMLHRYFLELISLS